MQSATRKEGAYFVCLLVRSDRLSRICAAAALSGTQMRMGGHRGSFSSFSTFYLVACTIYSYNEPEVADTPTVTAISVFKMPCGGISTGDVGESQVDWSEAGQ